MGSVGINVSSATSASNGQLGAGINVASTVASLLQVQELPEQQMQTQETQLNSQAQAIQSINSDLTNLETSIFTLTDFNGPLNAQTATSSNTSLVMASASGSAAAGQHQVIVNNLAQTSSMFTNEVSSSASIAPGSFNIQVGSGSAVAITVNSGDTLQDVANSINSANAGVTASVITDSSGSRLSLQSSTSGATGNITVSGNTSGLGFNSLYSNAVASSSSSIAAGTFDLQSGSGPAVAITVNSGDTLQDVVNSINSSNAGVTASIVTDSSGSRLSLQSSDGTVGNVTVSGNTSGLSFTSLAGADASLTVDGIPIDSSSNTVQNVIPGVTLNLVGANPNSTVTLGITPDTTQATSAIQSFVSAYNTAIQAVNAQYQYSPNSGASAPPLLGDSSLDMIQQQLYSAIGYSTKGASGINSLADLGITVNNDGTLSLNSSQLSAALSSNNSAAVNFLQNATTGFAQQMNSVMEKMTNPISGALNVDLSGINTTISSLQSQITDFQAQISTTQQQLTTEYDQVNTTLQQLPVLLQQINSQLGSI